MDDLGDTSIILDTMGKCFHKIGAYTYTLIQILCVFSHDLFF